MRNIAIEDCDSYYPVDRAYKAKHVPVFSYLLSIMKFDPNCKEFCRRIHGYCEKNILEKRR